MIAKIVLGEAIKPNTTNDPWNSQRPAGESRSTIGIGATLIRIRTS